MQLNPKIVWVLNLAPDSFSDWKVYTKQELENRITNLVNFWADIIDIWAESTAPNSVAISLEEELKRLEIFFEVIKTFPDETFSLDTMKSEVAKIWIQNWVKIINDVSGGRFDKKMFELIAENPNILYVMMYCKNTSGRADLKENIDKTPILEKIINFFEINLKLAQSFWISKNQIILDPWMWAFISTNYLDSVEILKSINILKKKFSLPIYIWTSRKWFLSKLAFDYWPQDRLWSSLASAIFACKNWANYIRVHDVKETKQFIETFNNLTK